MYLHLDNASRIYSAIEDDRQRYPNIWRLKVKCHMDTQEDCKKFQFNESINLSNDALYEML